MATNHAIPLQTNTNPLAQVIDRWIWVFMATFFIVITLTGFIPDSIMKVQMVQHGLRPPFPPILHVHAVLMGGVLLVLFAQAMLMATGRRDQHMLLGRVAFVLVPALVVVGFILVPTIYQQVWFGAHNAPPPIREKLQGLLHFLENIALLQIRIGFAFPICIGLALHARRVNSDFHKRMMFLAVATALPAAIDRITWLPTTMPTSPLSLDLYTLIIVSPIFLWDMLMHRHTLRVYLVWLAVLLPFTAVMYLLWDTQGWHTYISHLLEP